jgi:hypothetical protein
LIIQSNSKLNNMIRMKTTTWIFAALIILSSCKKDKHPLAGPKDPNTAEDVPIDRFSAAAGHLQVRTAGNGLPGPNQPIDFDQQPFITTGLSPDGRSVQYYNFDIQPTTPAPIWEFYKNGQRVNDQLNIVNVIPGDGTYNDFWQLYKVNVPNDYIANTITSYEELAVSGYTVEKTNNIVNCPVVPKGSTAIKRLNNGDAALTEGWYKGKLIYYFNFFEKPLMVNGSDMVPAIPIYVAFNINPAQPGGGPDSGFKTESATSSQTHNVLTALPSDAGYSPLWSVKVYDNASFDNVMDITTAGAAPLVLANAGLVNCPVVEIQ